MARIGNNMHKFYVMYVHPHGLIESAVCKMASKLDQDK